jgi:hypothetical protein
MKIRTAGFLVLMLGSVVLGGLLAVIVGSIVWNIV